MDTNELQDFFTKLGAEAVRLKSEEPEQYLAFLEEMNVYVEEIKRVIAKDESSAADVA